MRNSSAFLGRKCPCAYSYAFCMSAPARFLFFPLFSLALSLFLSLSYSLLLYLFLCPPPLLLAYSNFYLIRPKRQRQEITKKKSNKTPCFGLRGWGVERGKSFRAASSNQSNGFWESEGHKNRGNFSRKICAMLFREKMETNFLWKIGKVCPDCSHLINFRPCMMLNNSGGIEKIKINAAQSIHV